MIPIFYLKITQKGYSIASLVIGMAILVIVVMLSVSVIISGKKAEARGNLIAALEQEQSLLLHRSRSLSLLKEIMGLSVRDRNNQLVEVDTPEMNSLRGCFAGSPPPGGCLGFNNPSTEAARFLARFRNGNRLNNSSGLDCSGLLCQLTSTIEIRPSCSANRCINVEISARTTVATSNPNDIGFQSTSSGGGQGGRESKGVFPGNVFGKKLDLQLNCPSGFVAGINYETMQPTCRPLTGNHDCTSSGNPVNAINSNINAPGNCKTMAQGNCIGVRYGLNQLSLFGSETCVR
jgi:hypothetical protein